MPHPVIVAAASLPADQGEAAIREAAEVDAALAATEALDPDNALAERALLRAAELIARLYNRYVVHDGSGRLARWYFESLRTVQERAIARFGGRRGRGLIIVPWEPMPARRFVRGGR
jgi:hypothetical protein